MLISGTAVFEQIKTNQKILQKDMEKVQMQINNHWKQQQSCHQNPVLEQIQGNQAKIQEDVAKIQVQTGKHADMLDKYKFMSLIFYHTQFEAYSQHRQLQNKA
jgi:hypothetical protein